VEEGKAGSRRASRVGSPARRNDPVRRRQRQPGQRRYLAGSGVTLRDTRVWKNGWIQPIFPTTESE